MERRWTATVPIERTDSEIYEFACHERNYGAGLSKGQPSSGPHAAWRSEGHCLKRAAVTGLSADLVLRLRSDSEEHRGIVRSRRRRE